MSDSIRTRDGGRIHILLVDDEPPLRRLMTYILTQHGYLVTEAADGAAAIAAFGSGAFDLVTLDVAMPDMTGFAVCQAIRQHSMVPVLFISAFDAHAYRTQALQVGGNDYLTKPFEFTELVARVAALLAHERRADAPGTGQMPTDDTRPADI